GPPRAEAVPHAVARATHLATLPPRGPVSVAIPMDDWAVEVEPESGRQHTTRSVRGRAVADPALVEELARALKGASAPVLVAGPDIDASGGREAAVSLAEAQRLPVWASPAPGGGRLGFPEDHPLFQGILPPAIAPLSETLTGHDLVLVAGSSVFPYYPNIPGALLPPGTALWAITNDPDEAARAPMGNAIVADVALTLVALLAEVGASDREPPEPLPPAEPPQESDPMSPSAAVAALADVFPEDGIAVVESPSGTLAVRNRLRLSRPGSYYFS